MALPMPDSESLSQLVFYFFWIITENHLGSEEGLKVLSPFFTSGAQVFERTSFLSALPLCTPEKSSGL